MTHSPRLVVFDFDGTLVDSRQAVVASLNAALVSRGHPPVAPEAGIALIGLTLWTMFPRLVATPISEEEVDALAQAYKTAYLEQAARHERVYDGIPDLLGQLKDAGRRLAVATGKSTSGAHAGATRNGLHGYFERLYGFDAVPDPKPAPGLLLRLMKETDLGPDDTVIIGDTTYDIEMGRRAGVRSIGVTWGAHSEDQLRQAGADHVVQQVPELRDLLGVA